MKPEDIKIGSVWRKISQPHYRLEVLAVNNDVIHLREFYSHGFGDSFRSMTQAFLKNYEPVYVVEGFEV